MLMLFVVLYVLVYVECLVRRWLRALAVLTWACLMVLGSVLMWDSLANEAYAWEQVMVGADVTGLGYQQRERAIGTFCPLVQWAHGSRPTQPVAVALPADSGTGFQMALSCLSSQRSAPLSI